MKNGKPSTDTVEDSAVPKGELPEPPEGGGDADQVEVKDPATLLAEVTAERDKLSQEKDELLQLLQRRQADFENARRRAEKERSESFELAASAAEGPLADYAKGMELIYQRLMETLRKLGLEPMEASGKAFDPALHHAVQREAVEGAEQETVLEEFQRGYYFKGRLLRPAMVKVAVKA
jgi:molecular chaperone GrpE